MHSRKTTWRYHRRHWKVCWLKIARVVWSKRRRHSLIFWGTQTSGRKVCCSSSSGRQSIRCTQTNVFTLKRNTFFLRFVNGTIFYGLSWNSSNLGGDHYLNYILTGVVEYPAHLTLYIWLDKWGRKVFSCGAMLIAGMALVLTFLVPEGE